MNIKKYFRLNSREIKYILLTKNKFFLRWKALDMNLIDQYEWKNYNKFWIWVSIKYSKSAVMRNKIRRIFYDIIWKQWLVKKPIGWKYRKIYVLVKKDYPETEPTKIREDMKKDLNKLFKFILRKS